MIRTMVCVTWCAMSTAGATWGQATAAAPVFEVADVRLYQPQSSAQGIRGIIVRNGVLTNYSQVAGQRIQPGEPVFAPNGTVTLRAVTMRELIREAYPELANLRFNSIWVKYLTGGPDWLDTEHYELIAKATPGTPVDTERLMLQTVLGERFHLVIHREQKPMPVYTLVVGKKELKLQAPAEAGDPDCKNKFSQADGHTHVACTNITMAELVSRLGQLEPFDLDQPVMDSTNIKGAFDFNFEWTPRGPNPDPGGVTIFDAMEKLGLKIEARKQPMPVIVIDRVDRAPTDN